MTGISRVGDIAECGIVTIILLVSERDSVIALLFCLLLRVSVLGD